MGSWCSRCSPPVQNGNHRPPPAFCEGLGPGRLFQWRQVSCPVTPQKGCGCLPASLSPQFRHRRHGGVPHTSAAPPHCSDHTAHSHPVDELLATKAHNVSFSGHAWSPLSCQARAGLEPSSPRALPSFLGLHLRRHQLLGALQLGIQAPHLSLPTPQHSERPRHADLSQHKLGDGNQRGYPQSH
jgi:hypothetical protein